MTRGKYIVLEGPEGVGKTTQVQLLADTLRKAGLPVRVMREPDSQNDLTARAIRRLTQDPRFPMNTRAEVLLYNAARAQSLEVIRHSVEQGVICLVDRNYLTTLAVQYYGRGDVPEYDKINAIIQFAVNDMEPDLTIILDAEVSALKKRLKDRYSGERFDSLEGAFLERVRAGYLWEAKQRGLPIIYGEEPVEKVFKNVWSLVTKELAVRNKQAPVAAKAAPPQSVAQIIADHPPLADVSTEEKASTKRPKKGANMASPEHATEAYIKQTETGWEVTETGQAFLDEAVTNSTGDVYAFTDKIGVVTIAAAMARLSRRGDDLRVTLLDEFAGEATRDEKLLERVITAYGDDSVQQLVGQHVVVESASNLLTKKLEWGRLGSYLEQSTRYIPFDEKDKDGRYKYFVPEGLDPEMTEHYRKSMDDIFDAYSDMVAKLTDHVRAASTVPEAERDGPWRSSTRAQALDATRPVLPVATRATVGIFASGQALESLIMHLLSDELSESRATGQSILEEARKVIPVFLERADKPDRGGAWIAYRAQTTKAMGELAADLLVERHAEEVPAVQLVDHWPHNELDLVADMLYDRSNLPLEALRAEVADWPYDQKVKVFKAYMGERLNRRHRPGRALEKAHYSWDLVCDYGIFRDLQRHRMVDDLEWQDLTPRYGYDVPELIDQAGLSDAFDHCFDVSLDLFSTMQAAGYALEAQYATLLGHKMRWKVTYNAREAFHLHELRTSPQGHPGYRKLVQEMHQKLTEVHPLMGEAMIFVNKGEDPELARLAAERYTQFKLKQLDT